MKAVVGIKEECYVRIDKGAGVTISDGCDGILDSRSSIENIVTIVTTVTLSR